MSHVLRNSPFRFDCAMLTMLTMSNVGSVDNVGFKKCQHIYKLFFFLSNFCECVFCLKLIQMDMFASVSSNLSALFYVSVFSLFVFVLFLCLAFVLSLSFAFVFLAIQEAICPACSVFSFLCVYPCLGPMSCLCFCICICLCFKINLNLSLGIYWRQSVLLA